MILSLVMLVSSMTMGFSFLYYHLSTLVSIFEIVAATAPFGFTISCWFALILKSTIFRSIAGLPPLIGALVTLAQIAISYFYFQRIFTKRLRYKQFLQFSLHIAKELKYSFLFVSVVSLWMGYIHYTHSLVKDDSGWHVGGSVYGDLPFHLIIINSFLFGLNSYATPLTSAPQATFFADSNLVYPYIPDFHVALLGGSGMSLHHALFLPGIILTTSFLFLLFFLGLRMTNNSVAASISVMTTLLAGGVGGWYWLMYDQSWQGLVRVDHVLHSSIESGIKFYWFSLPAHILLPQRTTQYAYSIAVFALILLYRAYNRLSSDTREVKDVSLVSHAPTSSPDDLLVPSWLRLKNSDRLWLFGFSGFITGLLPLLQVHAFVSVGFVVINIAAIHCIQLFYSVVKIKAGTKKPEWKQQLTWWVVYGGVAWAVALPQSVIYIQKVLFPEYPESTTNFLRILPGIWSDFAPQPNMLLLWLEGLGFYLPVYLVSLFVYDRVKNFHFQVGYLSLFILTNFVLFQPWVLDNTKVFYISIFGFSPIIGKGLVLLWNYSPSFKKKVQTFSSTGSPLPKRHNDRTIGDNRGPLITELSVKLVLKFVCAVLLFGLLLSGFLCMVAETDSNSVLFDEVDIETGLWFYENTPYDSRVLVPTAGTHFRPSGSLGGRQLMSSYWGWISNHGMPNYAGRNHQTNQILKGAPEATDLLVKLNVTHIVLDWYQLRDYNVRFINSVANRVAINGKYIVYQVLPAELLLRKEECMPPGTPGHLINSTTCHAKGCSWIPNSDNKPWCQRTPVSSQYNNDLSYVQDCGWHGITENQCISIGCSYMEGYAGPFCQQPVGTPGSGNTGEGMMRNLKKKPGDNNCGFNGISEYQCRARGCDWVSTTYSCKENNKRKSFPPIPEFYASLFQL